MRSANLAAWAVGVAFGLLAIVLGLKVAFALSRGKGWRLKAFVIAVSLATLWWPGFIDRLCGQDKPPAQGTEQPQEKTKLKDSREWQEMVRFWEEICTLEWDQKSSREIEELVERGRELAGALLPIEEAGLLERGMSANIRADIENKCEVKPTDVKCYDSPGMATREVTWQSVKDQIAAIRKLQKEGKIKPWSAVKLVAQVKNDLAVLQGKKRGTARVGTPGKSAPELSDEQKKGVKEEVQGLLRALYGGGTIDQADEGPALAPEELQKKVAGLVAMLGSDDFSERERAQTELLGIGAPAFERLRQALTSEDPEVRQRARQVLDAFLE